jgi:hypothetical protein
MRTPRQVAQGNNSRHWKLPTTLLLGGIAVGFMLGRATFVDSLRSSGSSLNQPRSGSKPAEGSGRGAFDSSAAEPSSVPAAAFDRDSPFHSELARRVRTISREPNNRRRVEFFNTLIDELRPGELQQAAELAKQFPDTDRTDLHCAIVARWAQFDPKAAAEFALGEAGYMSGGKVMEHAMSAWVAMAPDAALSWAKALSGSQKDNTMAAFIPVFARRDPEAAFRLLGEQPENLKIPLFHHVASQWAHRDPQGLAQVAAAMPTGDEARRLTGAALYVWAQDDPQTALEWAGKLGDKGMQHAAVGSVYGAWAAANPDAAMESAVSLPAGATRDSALSTVARFASASNPEGAIELLRQVGNPITRGRGVWPVANELLRANNLGGAISAVSLMPSGEDRDHLLPHIAEGIASSDVGVALDWIVSLPPDDTRARALDKVLGQWGKIDPNAALQWMLKNEPPTGETSGARSLLDQWIARDRDGALSSLESLPEGRSRDLLIADALRKIKDSAPRDAAELASTILTGAAQVAASGEIAGSWASKDPAAAAAWAGGLKNEAATVAACTAVATAWAQQDLGSTAAWVGRLPAGAVRDQAVSAFAEAVVKADAEAAVAWAATITDSGRRDAMMQKLLETWIARDPRGARGWIDSSTSLSTPLRERLRAFRP